MLLCIKTVNLNIYYKKKYFEESFSSLLFKREILKKVVQENIFYSYISFVSRIFNNIYLLLKLSFLM